MSRGRHHLHRSHHRTGSPPAHCRCRACTDGYESRRLSKGPGEPALGLSRQRHSGSRPSRRGLDLSDLVTRDHRSSLVRLYVWNSKATTRWLPSSPKDVPGFILLLVFLPLVVPLVVLWLWFGLFLHVAIWLAWYTRGRSVLFVYSNSPNWQEYIEQRILPRFPVNAIIMNWSDRKKWNKLSLPVQAFYYFCGDVNCNPAAVVFRPFRVAKTFRFWQPLRDYKHGKTEPLAKVEQKMFDYIELK